MKTDNLSESEYDLTSDYQTTEENDVIIRNKQEDVIIRNKQKDNNLSNYNLIDYSTLNCSSCQEKPNNSYQKKSNNFSFLLISLSVLIIVIIYCFFRKKF